MLCQTNPSGTSCHLPRWGRHLTLPLPFVGKRKRKPIKCMVNIDFFNKLPPVLSSERAALFIIT